MIHANELRIGNLVKINNRLLIETENKVYKVTGYNVRFEKDFPLSDGVISLRHIDSIREYSQFIEFIEPIPLTEEWLLKFGFEKYNGYWHLFDGDMCFDLRMDFNFEVEGMKYGRNKIESVHKLQNLYFALTGQELTIKP